MVSKISCNDGNEHYDPNVEPHYHFICKGCSSVLDIEVSNLDFVNTLAEKDFDGKIYGHNAYFYGVCKGCLEK